MNFTFGIISSINSEVYLDEVIKSIQNQKIEKYEIFIIGDNKNNFTQNNIKQIPFNESEKKGWITKKKNTITSEAQYENIVFMHDYLKLEDNWYQGFLKYGSNFEVCMNKIITLDNQRYRDWTLWPLNNNKFDQYLDRTKRCLLPYENNNLSKYMYISGAYWVAKKKFMLKYPLNEKLLWGEGEDVEWSKKIRKKIDFKLNVHSSVKLLKEKDPIFQNLDLLTLKMITDYENNISIKLKDKSKIYIKKILKKIS